MNTASCLKEEAVLKRKITKNKNPRHNVEKDQQAVKDGQVLLGQIQAIQWQRSHLVRIDRATIRLVEYAELGPTRMHHLIKQLFKEDCYSSTPPRHAF